MNPKHIPHVLCLLLALLAGGCASLPANATDQQRLDAAKQTYTNANNIVAILIATGYIAKNDQPLKDAILQASATIRDAFGKAQEYLTAGNKVTFQFWMDRAMEGLTVFLQYQADGERKHRLSNPSTRPALPGPTHAVGASSYRPLSKSAPCESNRKPKTA
jgi:hypothetical protein